MSDVSITDLIAGAREVVLELSRGAKFHEVLRQNKPTSEKMRRAEAVIVRLIDVLESVTVPTENTEAPLKAAMEALDREENWSRDPDSSGWVYDIQSGARSIIARGFRLPIPVEPEWEYGVEYQGTSNAAAFIMAYNKEAALNWAAASPSEWKVRRRTKRTPAGEWQSVTTSDSEATQ